MREIDRPPRGVTKRRISWTIAKAGAAQPLRRAPVVAQVKFPADIQDQLFTHRFAGLEHICRKQQNTQ